MSESPDDGSDRDDATVADLEGVDATDSEPDTEAETDAETETESDPETDGDAETSGAPGTAAPERPAGRLLTRVAILAAALFVGAGAFTGAAAAPYLADRAAVATKMHIVKTAIAALTTLWNYTPETMDTLADRASGYLSGDLKAQYRKLIDTIVEANKQAKVTTSTQITGAAVESMTDREATVLVYMNTTGTSEAQQGLPSLKYLTYRLFMKRVDNRWLVTKMPTVTSLSLTPNV